MIILRKQIDGLIYSWTIYRDGRTVQAFFGVNEPWMLDEDIVEKTEERFTFRYQARRRVKELVAEKQADGYQQEIIPDPVPSQEEQLTFHKRATWFAYVLLGVGVIPLVTSWSLSPYVTLILAAFLFIMSIASGKMLPFWVKTMCFISYVLINISYRQAPDIKYLDAGLLLVTGVFLWSYMTKSRQRFNA